MEPKFVNRVLTQAGISMPNATVKNPLNDDHYTDNDDQIDDLKNAVGALQNALGNLSIDARNLVDSLAAAGGVAAKVSIATSQLVRELTLAAAVSAKYPDPLG